jgi:acetylornithine/succinyldiaminopimelate/putrescine aminotransferase
MCTESISAHFGSGDLGSTFGGGPIAAAAITATVQGILAEHLLANVRAREAQIREHCIVGPVRKIQGMGLLLGLVCDRPAVEVRDALLEHDILTGTSSDPEVIRILAPLVLQESHVEHLAQALNNLVPDTL